MVQIMSYGISKLLSLSNYHTPGTMSKDLGKSTKQEYIISSNERWFDQASKCEDMVKSKEDSSKGSMFDCLKT